MQITRKIQDHFIQSIKRVLIYKIPLNSNMNISLYSEIESKIGTGDWNIDPDKGEFISDWERVYPTEDLNDYYDVEVDEEEYSSLTFIRKRSDGVLPTEIWDTLFFLSDTQILSYIRWDTSAGELDTREAEQITLTYKINKITKEVTTNVEYIINGHIYETVIDSINSVHSGSYLVDKLSNSSQNIEYELELKFDSNHPDVDLIDKVTIGSQEFDIENVFDTKAIKLPTNEVLANKYQNNSINIYGDSISIDPTIGICWLENNGVNSCSIVYANNQRRNRIYTISDFFEDNYKYIIVRGEEYILRYKYGDKIFKIAVLLGVEGSETCNTYVIDLSNFDDIIVPPMISWLDILLVKKSGSWYRIPIYDIPVNKTVDIDTTRIEKFSNGLREDISNLVRGESIYTTIDPDYCSLCYYSTFTSDELEILSRRFRQYTETYDRIMSSYIKPDMILYEDVGMVVRYSNSTVFFPYDAHWKSLRKIPTDNICNSGYITDTSINGILETDTINISNAISKYGVILT